MNDADLVADASAIIALLIGEPITRVDPDRLAGSLLSAVNLLEVLARLLAFGMPEDDAVTTLRRLDLRIVPFDEVDAHAAARLRAATRQAGLSLGDRACLALAGRMGCPVITADRAWASLNLDVEVILIR